MSQDVLHFTCHGCGVSLTVPVDLAGVEGPCPKCGAVIRAPAVAGPVVEPPVSAPPGVPAPLPVGDPDSLSAAAGGSIRPEPREPHKRRTTQITPRRRTSDVARQVDVRAPREESSEGVASISRVLVPLAFLVIGGGIAYLLLQAFTGSSAVRPEGASEEVVGKPGVEASAVRSPVEEVAVPPSGASGTAGDVAGLAEQSIEAQDVLRDFLRASSIGARLPLIEPALERGDLEGTAIDTPLLSVQRMTPGLPVRNELENFVDHPFSVRFERDEAAPLSVLVVVRKRHEQKPKVLIEPLLDLFGGRLRDFAAAPVDEPGTFHAVIEALPRCFDETVPNPENKISYKLAADIHDVEITRAYVSKFSPLAEMLYSPDSELRWGKRLPATVTVKWNREEAADDGQDPAQPYLELIEIKSLDWSQ